MKYGVSHTNRDGLTALPFYPPRLLSAPHWAEEMQWLLQISKKKDKREIEEGSLCYLTSEVFSRRLHTSIILLGRDDSSLCKCCQ